MPGRLKMNAETEEGRNLNKTVGSGQQTKSYILLQPFYRGSPYVPRGVQVCGFSHG